MTSPVTLFVSLLFLLFPAQLLAMAVPSAVGTCPPGTQMCLDGSQCYTAVMRCDGTEDCNDGTDEYDCEHSVNDSNITCPEGSFPCKSGDQCVERHLRCDKTEDCPDGSDEYNCSVECNGEHLFQCKNGNCIDIEHHCDGKDDCGDSSDEEECSLQINESSTPQILDDSPAAEVITTAVPLATTTVNSTATTSSNQCGKDEFQCNDGTCLHINYKCDSKPHCPDGSDEGPLCQDKYVQADCQDGFLCHNLCIPSEWVCDGNNDCIDGADEEHCHSPPPVEHEPIDTCYNLIVKKEGELRMKRETDIDPLMKLKLEIAKQECYNQHHLYNLKVKELLTRNEVAQTQLQAAELWRNAMKERLQQQRTEHQLSVASLIRATHSEQSPPSTNGQTDEVKTVGGAESPALEIE